MENPDGVGESGDITCGDMARLFIRVKDEVITEASFQVFGCGAAIASTDMACCLITGKTIAEALDITNEDVIKSLGGLPPEKEHCSVMAEETIVKAVDDYRNREGTYYDHLSYYSPVICNECVCGQSRKAEK